MITPRHIHLVGIGGIGMSGLAQLLSAAGHRVSGSDRAADAPENASIFDALRAQRIAIHPQDGSYVNTGLPDELIYSTAIEEDNPDFVAGQGVARIHRAAALQDALVHWNAETRIAVTGSAGKTTVSAWLGETLFNLGRSPTVLSGGILNRFRSDRLVGNFVPGEGAEFVFEADESDKSVLRYHPEYALILNIGTDHYSKAELIEVFTQFLEQTSKGAVLEHAILSCFEHLDRTKYLTFSLDSDAADFTLRNYCYTDGAARVVFRDPRGVEHTMRLPVPGRHNAANALAILAMLEFLGVGAADAIPAMENFSGAWRRFDFAGSLPVGARVYDDYAHNPEKIASVINTAREVLGGAGRLIVLFQPHGFGPLKFMREALGAMLYKSLVDNDIFMLLPVFYAGGTTSFTPSSEEVAAEIANGVSFRCIAPVDRIEAAKIINENASQADIVLVLGARDNSLSVWSKELTRSQL